MSTDGMNNNCNATEFLSLVTLKHKVDNYHLPDILPLKMLNAMMLTLLLDGLNSYATIVYWRTSMAELFHKELYGYSNSIHFNDCTIKNLIKTSAKY